MAATVLLITPPFTQLNTPYPATAYLKGFLNTKNITSFQADLGIEVTVELFSKNGLNNLFASIDSINGFAENTQRIISLQEDYIQTIDSVMLFLQGKNPTLAHQICKRGFLPEASRFAQIEDLTWAFGSMGMQDRAKHLATMYLEDLSDMIKETVDEHFGFSRYAEKLGRSANSFDELYEMLQKDYTYIDTLLIKILEKRIQEVQPQLVALSIPFPGNLYAGLRCGQWIKQNFPSAKVVMGGGFPNTELRSLSDARVFELVDFITLDDGEAPIENLLLYLQGNKTMDELKRTFTIANNEACPTDRQVTYINNTSCTDYRQGQVGTPDYSDFFLDQYISAMRLLTPCTACGAMAAGTN